ncbi:MAG TPA: lipase maturation factor family protein [Gemmatimonadaceae bacterium]|nr:lipase maturation factor family protein [Gemmatimonadaceae bacterium]
MSSISEFFGGTTESNYWLTRLVLQRGLAGIYAIAFLVAINQFRPLLGAHGLTPVPAFLQQTRFVESPSVFFAHYSDTFAMVLSWSGLLCALLAITGLSERFGTPVHLLIWGVMWVAYLSIVNVGQTWYSFGWESLLLECGFLAIFLGARHTAPPAVVIWMYRWVLFRLMFGAGMIKLRGDPCWRDLTCLVFHYETQPIPNPISWYLAKSPLWMNKAGVLFNHLAELIAPFGALVPVPMVARIAGAIMVLFQLSIAASGNLSWLNWLTIVVGLSCFDDAVLRHVIPGAASALERSEGRDLQLAAAANTPMQVTVGLLTLMVVLLSIRPAINLLSRNQMMNASFEPLHLVNTYGAFGSVSRERYEVVLEGTADSLVTPASTWAEYEFRAKPGGINRRLPWLAPYHRRLDWLMWFIPLSPGYAEGWFAPLIARLLQNDRPTLSLMARNPFPDKPPTWIRAAMYKYRFTTVAERSASGGYWVRTRVGEMMRPLSLATPGFTDMLQASGWVR